MNAKGRMQVAIKKSVGISSAAIIIVSLFLNWTKNREAISLMKLYIPGGWYIFLFSTIAFMIALLLPLIHPEGDRYYLSIQVVCVTVMLFLYLMITKNYSDFANQWDTGYYLNALGLIFAVLYTFISIIAMLNLGNQEPAHKREEDKEVQQLEDLFFEALNHKVRRRILRIIAEKGHSSFKEFKSRLEIGTGTLYHHLKILNSLIFQKKDKKYYLTKLGILTLDFMRDNLPHLKALGKEEFSKRPTGGKFKDFFKVFDTKPFFDKLIPRGEKMAYALILPVAFIMAGAFMGFENRLYFFVWRDSAIDYSVLNAPGFMLEGLISWISIWFIIEAACYINFKKRGDVLRSFIGVGLSMFPIFCFELFVFILDLLLQELLLVKVFLLIFTQLITLYFLITFQMGEKSLKKEKALSVVLPAHYISMFVNILLFLLG